ncbi:hypothetical protein M5G27_29770 [Pseudomonas shahriarae]|uniref:Uncharacterized protein n=1 Tax=Pseudomonas shahriarae TaxID=2745512 RepID=A0A9X4C841_9PSED|nr:MULTISPECIES: hypothetical protein [Pseudomonas]KNH45206.1 hypothetical protein ACS73_16215 [Pseudomonas lini]MDD1011648.1 hypothetical protein [Pseudomonas shahriarae]
MGKLDDDDTLKMLVKLTSESKLLYKDLESTPKMRRARRLLYLAQLGLMTEKTLEGEQSTGVRMPMPAPMPGNEVKAANAQDEVPKDAVHSGVLVGDAVTAVTAVTPSPLPIEKPTKDQLNGNRQQPNQPTAVGRAQVDEVVSAVVSPGPETSPPAQLLNRNRPAFKSSLA